MPDPVATQNLALALLPVVLVFGGGCMGATGTDAAGVAMRTTGPRAAPVARSVTSSDNSPPRLDVRCENADRCPASIGMVVFGGDPPERCTGTLVAEDKVLTASHCVDLAMRAPGARCPGGWIAFPAAGPYPALWVACDEVLEISEVSEDGVLRADYALIALRSPVRRPVAEVVASPVEPGTIVSIASVTPNRIYATQHELAVHLCRATSAEEAEAVLGAEARHVGWLSNCPILPGNSGSPVLDREGHVRALVHGGSHPFFGIGVTTILPTLLGADLEIRRFRDDMGG